MSPFGVFLPSTPKGLDCSILMNAETPFEMHRLRVATLLENQYVGLSLGS